MSTNRSFPRLWVCFVVCGIAVLSTATAPLQAQSRKRIAILQFDDRTAGTRDMNIGAKVADVLVSKLASNATFEVIDRENLATILSEQNLKLDSRFEASGAAKLGKLANVDAIVVGQINSFNANVAVETKIGFVATKQTSVGTIDLKVTARVINVETGSIISAPAANVEQKGILAESSTSNLIQGVASKSTKDVRAGLLDLVDKSVGDVAESLSTQIVGVGSAIPSIRGQSVLTAKVVGIQDGLVLANKGTSAGIKVGDKFTVARPVDTGLKDPDTGKPVVRRKKICILSISETEDSVSSGQCEGEIPQAGDELSPTQR